MQVIKSDNKDGVYEEQKIPCAIWGYICNNLDTKNLNSMRLCSVYLNHLATTIIYDREVGISNPFTYISQCFATRFTIINDTVKKFNLLKAQMILKYLIINTSLMQEVIKLRFTDILKGSFGTTTLLQKNILLVLFHTVGEDYFEKIKLDMAIGRCILHKSKDVNDCKILKDRILDIEQSCSVIRKCYARLQQEFDDTEYGIALSGMIRARQYCEEDMSLEFLNDWMLKEPKTINIIKAILYYVNNLSTNQQLQIVRCIAQLIKEGPSIYNNCLIAMNLISGYFINYANLDEVAKNSLLELMEVVYKIDNDENYELTYNAIDILLRLERYSDNALDKLMLLNAVKVWTSKGDWRIFGIVKCALDYREDLNVGRQFQMMNLIKDLGQSKPGWAKDFIEKHFLKYLWLDETVQHCLSTFVQLWANCEIDSEGVVFNKEAWGYFIDTL